MHLIFLANILNFNYNYNMKKAYTYFLTVASVGCSWLLLDTICHKNYVHAAWAIMIANVFDGLDGWVARLTNSTTRFGIELDSLSDLVAFGVAPAVMIYKWSIAPFSRIGAAARLSLLPAGPQAGAL
jgi:phosphatidylserine synthase